MHISTTILTISLSLLLPVHADPICIDAILSTIPYSAALKPHTTANAASCPTGTPGGFDLAANSAGCCASSLRIITVGVEGAACCPCGAQCTGYLPDLLEWSESGTKLDVTPASTANPTITTTVTSGSVGTVSSASSSFQNGTVTTGTGGVPVRPTSSVTSAPSVGTGGAVGLFERGRGEVWGILGFVAMGLGAVY